MTALGIDLGGTKISLAVFTESGDVLDRTFRPLEKRSGKDVADLIIEEAQKLIAAHPSVQYAGIAVPGIYYHGPGTVWAPNISGWEEYPLLQHFRESIDIPVTIDSDRACCILGESWLGNARGCTNAIYLAVGTGIGAGILIEGKILRGSHDIAGAIGWMAIQRPFQDKYIPCGCFEYHASGEGIARMVQDLLVHEKNYSGILSMISPANITAHDVFAAFEENDALAKKVFDVCIGFWGMATANLVSLFNPEKIIFGGGVFGPAVQFIPAIIEEAKKWAQPISIKQVKIEASSLGPDAGLIGAGLLAFQSSGLHHVKLPT